MELIDALRSTGACREFTSDPVADEVVARLLDTARFAPNGGNRQGWRVIVVKDPGVRRAVRDLYLPGWREYVAQGMAGLTPWSPANDPDAEAAAIANAGTVAAAGWHDRLDTVPVLLVLLADLAALATVDKGLGRYTLAGGASIYPFAWSLLLAARAEGLGGVMTTMPIRREPALKEVLRVPDHVAVAAVMALGHPARQVTRLKRAPVDSFASVDRWDGERFSGQP